LQKFHQNSFIDNFLSNPAISLADKYTTRIQLNISEFAKLHVVFNFVYTKCWMVHYESACCDGNATGQWPATTNAFYGDSM